MSNYRVAYRYGIALMQSAEEEHLLEQTASDAEMIAKTVRENRELRLLLTSPIIVKEKKKRVLSELFEKKVGRVTVRFLNLLTEKDREGQLLEILEQFLHLFDEKRGILRIEVASAVDLTKTERDQLKSRLESYTGKTVVPTFRRDAALLGGFVVQLDDRVIDASLAHQLNLLRDRFLEGSTAGKGT